MPSKIGQNSFENGLNTDVNLYSTPSNVLVKANNITQSTLAEDQFILQNEDGNASVIYKDNPVALTAGYVPVSVKVYNNIAYILSVDTKITARETTDVIESEYIGDGLTVHYNYSTSEYGISGAVSRSGTGGQQVGNITTLPLPTSGTRFINWNASSISFGAFGVVYNHSVIKNTVMPVIKWSETAVNGSYKTEIGTFPSPNWDLLLQGLPSDLKETYSPIHNFKVIGGTDYISPFRAHLGNTPTSNIDIEIQQSYDASVNIIFTDGKNPIRLVNSRFKVSDDNINAYVLADRLDLVSRDTNVYSAEDPGQTNLVFTLSNIPELTFNGVLDSAGRLPEGNYRYYFKAVDADGNETPIIEESRTVSIFSGKGKTAHSSTNGLSSKASSFLVSFSDKDIENIAGINVYYSHFSGEFDAFSTIQKLQTTFRNKVDNAFTIVHTGLEPFESVAASELNVQYSPVTTAKTLAQIRSRLALANVSYDSVDLHSIAEGSFRVRVGEEDITLDRKYSDAYTTHTRNDDIPYSTPEDIYGENGIINPGIGYWREETYVVGINWILENDFVTDTFPIKGIDRVTSPSGSYTDEDSDTHDYIQEPFKSSTHENRLGVYRTSAKEITDSEGNLIIKKLKFSGVGDAVAYLKDKGVPIKGYFFTRKDRVKDCLWEGLSGGLHRLPVLQNFQGSTWWDAAFNSDNDNRIFFLPALGAATEDWENMYLATVGNGDVDEANLDFKALTAAGLKLVPSNGGWLEITNPHIDGYNDGYRSPVNGDSIRDFVSQAETGSYDYRLAEDGSWDKRIENFIQPNTTYTNRVAFHSADMLVDPASVARDFESDISFEISTNDAVTIGFKSSEIGTSGRSLVNKFYLQPKTNGSFKSGFTACGIEARLIDAGKDVGVEEAYSGLSDRNVYKYNRSRSAYETNDTTGNPVDSRAGGPVFFAGSGKQQWNSGSSASAPTIKDQRPHDVLRSLSVVSTEYGSYYGCNLVKLDDPDTLVNVGRINGFTTTKTYISTRFSDYKPTTSTYRTFGRYTRVFSGNGSIKTNATSWKALYTNLSGTYKSISKRYKVDYTADVSVGEGDCFVTIAWKQLTRKRGLPNNITETNPTVDTYYRNLDTLDDSVTEAASKARSCSDVKSSGPLAYTQGLYVPLIHQNNNNVAIRSIEEVEPTEKNLIGSDREYYPLRSTDTLRARPQVESNKYNFGLNTNSDKFYTVANTNVPAVSTEFSTRVVLSNATATSEFSNGYRSFENINFKDYNRDFGSITKLESFNNSLYCIQESAVSLIGVDDRTLTTEAASGKVFINSGDLLPSTLTNISSEYGSTEFNSIIQTDVGIFGVDYIKNRPWKIEGSGIKLLSEFKVQTTFNEFKAATKSSVVHAPIIKTHFDRLTNKIYFNYNIVSTEDFKGTGLGRDQNLVYNTNTKLWVGETHFTPGISFSVNDGFYSIPQNGIGFWKHNQVSNTEFYGIAKEVSIEFVMLGDGISGQKILENLKIISNNVTPIKYSYTIEDTTTYNMTKDHSKTNYSFEEPAIIRGDIISNAKGEFFRANIMQANTQYRENTMDVQVGKAFNTAARIRDKAIKIKIVYDGTEKVAIQQVLSIYRDSFA